MTGALAPILVAVIIAASDLWVYLDAQRHVRVGSSVVMRIGGITIETPLAWLIGSIVLWIFFFPAYVVSRSTS